MGRKFGTFVKSALIISNIFVFSCGKTEKVVGVKGPQGDKGPQGEQGLPAPIPTPISTPQKQPLPEVTTSPTIQFPQVIIVLPTQQCNMSICPQGTMLVCACLDGVWQTISIAPTDVDKIRVRNYGRCDDYYKKMLPEDCIWWPRQYPQPTVTITAIPPAPTPTVTITVIPKPNQC
jgi:hypothetical protein